MTAADPQAEVDDLIERLGKIYANHTEADLCLHREAMDALAALRDDAARYRWLREHGCGHEAVSENDHGIDIWLGNEALDAAIDAARGKP